MPSDTSTPGLIPFTPDEQSEFLASSGGAASTPIAAPLPASPAPAVESPSPASGSFSSIIPYTAPELRQLMASDPYFTPTFQQAETLRQDDKAAGVLGRAGRTLKGMGEGFGQLPDLVSAAHNEMKDAPFTVQEGKRTLSTLAEGGARLGMFVRNTVPEVLEKTGFSAMNLFGDDEDAARRYYDHLLLLRRDALRARGLPETKPENFDPAAPSFVLSPKIYGNAPPYDKAADVVSMVLPIPGVGAAEDVAKTAAGGLVRRIPGAAAASEKISQLPGAVAGVAEQGGRTLQQSAKLPEQVLTKAAQAVAPQPVRDALEKAKSLIGPGAAIGMLTGHGGALTATAAGLKSAQALGSALEHTGAFFRHLSETDPNAVSRLVDLSKKADAPDWIKKLAGSLHDIGAGTVAQTGLDVSKSAAGGAVSGAVLGEATGQEPEQVGQFAGMGAFMGAAGRGLAKITGAEARARELARNQHFYAYATTPVEKGGLGLAPERAAQIDPFTRLTIGAAHSIDPTLKFRFLDPKQLATEAGAAGQSSGAAWYDPATHEITLALGDKTGRVSHELEHAFSRALGADNETRALIDSQFSPQQLDISRREYAQRLVDAELGRRARVKLSPEDYAAKIDNKVNELNQGAKGPNWIYDEIAADAGAGVFQNTPLAKIVSQNSTVWSRIGNKARAKVLNAFGITADAERTSENPPPAGRLFTDDSIYSNPDLRRMVYEHVRKVWRGASPDGGVKVTPGMWGKFKGTPVHDLGNGVKGNDFVVQKPNGEIVNRKPFQTKRIVKSRQEEVNAAFPETATPAPETDKTPEVKSRTSPSGQVERSGTKFGDTFDKLKTYGPAAKAMVKVLEKAMETGGAFAGWYHQIGAGPDWKTSVRKETGNIEAQYKEFVPFDFFISKNGNALVRNYSLTAFDRKAARWSAAHGDASLNLWGGDPGLFAKDVQQYLKNHSEGRPGADVVGDQKRDVINAFLVGGNRTFETKNPLRALLRGEDRQGIVRSYRLDRLETLEPSERQFGQPEYNKQVRNLSPQVEGAQFSPPVDNAERAGQAGNEESDGGDKSVAVTNPVWFSQLEKVVDEKFSGKQMPAAQLDAVLRNPQNGVKADELKWSGLSDFLKGKDRVSKAEVQQFVADHQLQINEIVKGGPQAISPALRGYLDRDHNGEAPGTPEGWINLSGKLERLAQQWQKNGDAYQAQRHFEMSEEAGRRAEGLNPETGSTAGEPKYSPHQLPGGENYREILFTLPTKNVAWKNEQARLFEKYGTDSQIELKKLASPAEWTRYDSLFNESQRAFKSTHYDEPNVLAHTRVNDRVDSTGKPGLFVEEIQSDWHQRGRKEGYNTPGEFPKEFKVVKEGNTFSVVDDRGDVWLATIRQDNAENLARIRNEQAKNGTLPERLKSSSVPDAPLKNTWHEFVMRRLVRMAAEEGKDWLGWTTGAQQSDRYDLSKQVSLLSAKKEPNGKYLFYIEGKDGQPIFRNINGFSEHGQKVVTPAEMEELVGKEPTKKLTEGADAKPVKRPGIKPGPPDFFDLTGPDLKIGGEGMKGFYDKILVDYANKLGKKFGASVQDITVTPTAAGRIAARMSPAERADYIKGIAEKGGVHTVHALPLTPELKAKVMKGQALFSPETEEPVQKTETENDSPWFSQLQRVIEQKMPERAPVGHVRNLLDPAKGYGVKPDEVKWTGLDDWLAKQTGSVTKQQVLDYLRENKLNVNEVVKDSEGKKSEFSFYPEWSDLTYAFDEPSDHDPDVPKYKYVGELAASSERDSKALVTVWEESDGTIRLGDETGQPLHYAANHPYNNFKSLEEAKRVGIDVAREKYNELYGGGEDGTKYNGSNLNLPGGENYKELLFTLPSLMKFKEFARQNEHTGLWRIVDENGKEVDAGYQSQYAAEREIARRAGLKQNITLGAEINHGQYRSGHWDEPNVLAHTRFDDRTDADGKKTLFLQEVQSDWHREGRKHGYKNEIPRDHATARRGEGFWRVDDPNSNFITNVLDADLPAGATADDAIAEAARRLRESPHQVAKQQGVPDAPFKNTWHEMVFRRMVRWAAENGYDQIAWTTGEQQIERYDLSKHVDSIAYKENGGGHGYDVDVRKGDNSVVTKYDQSPEQLSALLGKDIAQKILTGQGAPTNMGVMRLTGLDLKVGGEGKRRLYDKMLVDFANKFGKKFGAKVSEAEIPTSPNRDLQDRAVNLERASEGEWVWHDDAGNRVGPIHGDKTSAHQWRARIASSEAVHSLPITPEMKASVMGGQALFSPKVSEDHGWSKDFPSLVTQTTIAKMKSLPDYAAAKAGDREAAAKVAETLFQPARFKLLAAKYPDAILVPIRAEEKSGRNQIPNAFAAELESHFPGWKMEDDIIQNSRAFHTGASAAERMLRTPEFDGEVTPGKNYILIDDVVTSGSTIAALRKYIQERGGKVVAAASLATTSNQQTGYGGIVAIQPETVKALKSKFDSQQLERLMSQYGIADKLNHLTNSQGRYLLTFGSLDSLRNRLSEAAHQGVSRVVSGKARGAQAGQGKLDL